MSAIFWMPSPSPAQFALTHCVISNPPNSVRHRTVQTNDHAFLLMSAQMIKGGNKELEPYEWVRYSLIEGLDVIELHGDAGLDAWFDAAEFPDTQPMETT